LRNRNFSVISWRDFDNATCSQKRRYAYLPDGNASGSTDTPRRWTNQYRLPDGDHWRIGKKTVNEDAFLKHLTRLRY
jgi:hypothetical protein